MIPALVGGMFGGGVTANSYESIQTVTVGVGGATTVTFSSIPSTYSHLQVRFIGRSTTGGVANSTMTFNGSGTGYSWHYLQGDGTSATAGALASTAQILAGVLSPTANTFGAGVIDILDYANTNKNKTVRNLNGVDWNGSGYALMYSGSWQNTNAINSITFAGTTFTQYSQFALYGVK